MNIILNYQKKDAAEPIRFIDVATPPDEAVATVYCIVKDRVVEFGSRKTDWDWPDGRVKDTIWDVKLPKLPVLLATNKLLLPPTLPVNETDVIPSGATFTEYDRAESGREGGKSYFMAAGSPIAEEGKTDIILINIRYNLYLIFFNNLNYYYLKLK